MASRSPPSDSRRCPGPASASETRPGADGFRRLGRGVVIARLRLFARAREAAGCSADDFPAAHLGELLDQACAAYGAEFAAVLATAAVWVNGEEPGAGRDTELLPDDEVAVLPPVSGGS
ncbi:MAG: MoaD/ThiS family protein [Acidimicrobiia bacterium]